MYCQSTVILPTTRFFSLTFGHEAWATRAQTSSLRSGFILLGPYTVYENSLGEFLNQCRREGCKVLNQKYLIITLYIYKSTFLFIMFYIIN